MYAKRDYYLNVFNWYSTNLQTIWQTINETLNRTKEKRNFPQEIKLSYSNIISDLKEIVNAFNDFFIGIGDTGLVNASRNIDFNQYMSLKTNCTLIFQAITVSTTSRIIVSLIPKTSTGVDSCGNLIKLLFQNP